MHEPFVSMANELIAPKGGRRLLMYQTFTLSNGLRIIHRSSQSAVVYCGYQINAGSRNEQEGEEGLAHFCEHVTFKGTKRRRAWYILNCLESVGGDLNAFTNKEDTVYYAAILKEHVARAVDLLTDIVFHSTYPDVELNKEKEVISDEIESYNDSPAELIYDEFEDILFKGHPLGHSILGTKQLVRAFTSADALRFTQKYYRPNNAIFFIDGDVDFKYLIRLLSKATADLPSTQPLNDDTELKVNLHPYIPTSITQQRDTHQTHVMIGSRAYNIHHPNRIALYLLNNILGGPSMNARLNVSLREHHGLVYMVESSMVSYSDTGLWSVYFGCDPHDVKRCMQLVRRELCRVIDVPLTPYQLNAAKKQLKGQIGVACDNRESFALDFGKCFLHYGWEKDITALYNQIDIVTAQQVQQVAQDIMTEDKLSVLLIGHNCGK